MKLWKRGDHHEGEKFPDDAFFVFGKLFDESNPISTGWYFMMNFPYRTERLFYDLTMDEHRSSIMCPSFNFWWRKEKIFIKYLWKEVNPIAN